MIYVAGALVVAALVAMASGRVDPLLALLVALILAGILGIAPADQLAAGLSNAGVITVAAMLVIAKGIVQTGIVSRATWALLASTSTAQQVFRRLSLPIGVASALINTTPLVALLIPAARQLEQTKRIPAREVLLPIAHVTTLAGSVTLIGTSSNLVIAGIAGERGVDISMFSIAAVALPVALVGAAVVYLTGTRALRGPVDAAATSRDWRVEIPVAAPARAENRRAAELGISKTQEYELAGIQRWGTMAGPEEPIEAGDLLVFAATEEGIAAIWRIPLFGMSAQRLYAVSVSAGEPASLHDFERDGSLRIIAARSDRSLHESELNPGETCYVTAESEQAVARNPAVALWQTATSRAPQPSKTLVALGVLLCVIVAASFGRAEGPRPARGLDRARGDRRRERPRRRHRRRDLRPRERDARPRDRARPRHHGHDEPRDQRGHGGDRHARRPAHREGHGRRSRTRPRPGRHVRLLHAHQPLQPPVQRDGHAARRLHGSAVRALRRADPRGLRGGRLRGHLSPAHGLSASSSSPSHAISRSRSGIWSRSATRPKSSEPMYDMTVMLSPIPSVITETG
jgi:hypothetical protein